MASKTKIQQMTHDLELYYGNAHKAMHDAERMVMQNYDGLIDVPYEVRIFKSSMSANIVAGFRNQIRTNEPTVDFHPYGLSKKALKHSTLMQRWGYAMMRREREYGNIDPNAQMALNLLKRGAACKKIVVDVDKMLGKAPKPGSAARQDWDDMALRTWPFVSRAIDPLSILPAPGQSKPLEFIIEKQTRYAGEMWGQYPEWSDPAAKGKNAKNPARRVEWLEYWTPQEYTVEADGELVFSKDNPYGCVPYIFEWAGMGEAHNDGDPVHLAVNILTEILGELEEEVRLKTAIGVQTQMHVFPPILTVEDPRKVARQFGVGPGKVIRHPPGHPPEYMQYPPPNENFYRFLDAIHSNIMRVAGSAIQGGRDPGVQYGVLQAQLVGQSLTNIAAVRSTLDRMGGQALNMMARMMNRLDISMAIEGSMAEEASRVTSDDFKHFNFEVAFEAVDPAENDRMLMVGQALRRAGDLSRFTFHKKYAKHVVEDPDWESVLIAAEQVLEQMIASGMMQGVVMDEDVMAQMAGQATEQIQQVQKGVQNRQDPTVPERTRLEVQEMERRSGTPGSLTIPREIAEAGMDVRRPSQTGVPGGA